jgi:hypothetical protein
MSLARAHHIATHNFKRVAEWQPNREDWNSCEYFYNIIPNIIPAPCLWTLPLKSFSKQYFPLYWIFFHIKYILISLVLIKRIKKPHKIEKTCLYWLIPSSITLFLLKHSITAFVSSNHCSEIFLPIISMTYSWSQSTGNFFRHFIALGYSYTHLTVSDREFCAHLKCPILVMNHVLVSFCI